jgi:NAD-dependent histone deacetylase SIR2
MGNEESTMVSDSTRPSVLEARNIEAVAKYIKKHNARKIVVMVRRLLRPVCTES